MFAGHSNGVREHHGGVHARLREKVAVVTRWSATEEEKASKGHRRWERFRKRVEGRPEARGGRETVQEPATPRTPGPAAGCNKPAGLSRAWSLDQASAEEAAEAGRNGKSGTRLKLGSFGPKLGRRFKREWTQGQGCR